MMLSAFSPGFFHVPSQLFIICSQDVKHIQMQQKKPFPLKIIKPAEKTVELQKLHEIRNLSSLPTANLILIVSSDTLILYDKQYDCIVRRIKRLSSIRSATLCADGKMILCHFSDNTLRMISTKNGNDIGQYIGLPPGSINFHISEIGNRIIGGNNKSLCVWRTRDFAIQMYSSNWSNMNCSAINSDGSFFSIGTYNGQIYLLKLKSHQQCIQINYNRHEKCVMVMAWHGKRKLISVSFDETLVIMEMKESQHSEKELTFTKFTLGAVPKHISCMDGVFFFTMNKGMMMYSEEYGTRVHLENDRYYPLRRGKDGLELVKFFLATLEFYKLQKTTKRIMTPYNRYT